MQCTYNVVKKALFMVDAKQIIKQIKANIAEYDARCPDGILFFDTETTGLDYDDRVIHLCIVGDDKTVIVDTLINTRKKIHPKARAVHGLTNNDLKGYPTFAQIQHIVMPFLAKHEIWSYNIDYDLHMILNSCTSAYHTKGIPHFKKIGCLMEWFAEFYGDWNDYYCSYTWKKLGFACKYFRIELIHAHNALYDTLACVDLYHALKTNAKGELT